MCVLCEVCVMAYQLVRLHVRTFLVRNRLVHEIEGDDGQALLLGLCVCGVCVGGGSLCVSL